MNFEAMIVPERFPLWIALYLGAKLTNPSQCQMGMINLRLSTGLISLMRYRGG